MPRSARQILEWVYQKGVVDPDEMTNLSKKDQDTLKAEMTFLSARCSGANWQPTARRSC